MTPYPKYKPSGIELIGDMPKHWEVKKVKHIISKENGVQIGPFGSSLKSDFIKSSGYKIYGQENAIKDDFSLGYKYVDEDKFKELEKYELLANDIIITMMGTTGRCKVVPSEIEKGIMDSHLIRIRLDEEKMLSYYFTVLINDSYTILNNIKFESRGSIMDGLNSSIIKSLFIPLPPPEEQTAIANYLDTKTTAIDQLIADKERLLQLYEEEKTALINRAVTKGLNPDAPMRDSGIAWLGEIPEHWEVKKLKYAVVKIGSGVTPSGGASVYQLSGIPLLRSQNVHFDGLKLADVAYITSDVHDKMSNSKVLTGDVLLNITGASIGRSYYVEDWLGEANVNQHVCIIRPKQNILTKFLYYLLRSNIGQEQITNEQTGSGREGLNFESLKNFNIPFVEPSEQQAIVNHIETETAKIEAQVARTRKLIELLTEYRTALISEVVTGKIKVM